jgi:hypothetical protein
MLNPLGLILDLTSTVMPKKDMPTNYLISFPKCGRTWLGIMLGHYISHHFQLDTDGYLDLGGMHELKPRVPIITKRHDDKPVEKVPSALKRRKWRYWRNRVIFLVRDPRDVITSRWFAVKHREKIRYEGELNEYLRDDVGSLATIVEYFNIWYDQRTCPRDFLLVRYEDLHKNTATTLRRILEFIGIDNVDNALLDGAVAFGSFENMRALEDNNAYNKRMLRPETKGDFRSYKTRKGVIGDHRNLLDAKDLAFVDELIDKHLNPDFGYTKRSTG